MPNYVYNVLYVIGNKSEIDKFYNANKPVQQEHSCECELSFNMLVPEPENCNWYEWRCNNWGCKWDSSNTEYQIKNNMGQYTFSTPWNYPLPWLKTVSKIFPTLTFHIKYEDEGFNFFGTSIVKNGNERQVESYNYCDIINYITINGKCSCDELLEIAKKYDYKGSNQCYDDFINALEEYIQTKEFKYGFDSSLFENIIIKLIEKGTPENYMAKKD